LEPLHLDSKLLFDLEAARPPGSASFKSFILKRRNASFSARYLPGFRQFFERGTPVLQSGVRPL